MKPRARPENAIQSDIVGFLRAVLAPPAFVYANANAAQRTASGRAANGVPGLLPGVPDVSVLLADGSILYFEVKSAVGRLSEAQERVIGRISACGARVAVVRSVDDVAGALRSWGVVTREAA